jgi:hypothetical protein
VLKNVLVAATTKQQESHHKTQANGLLDGGKEKVRVGRKTIRKCKIMQVSIALVNLFGVDASRLALGAAIDTSF